MNRMLKRLASTAQSVISRSVRPFGYQLVKVPHEKSKVRINIYNNDVRETVAAAHAAGQTVCQYVETLWDQLGCTARVVAEMEAAGVVPCERVVEIGPGTGRYLELVLRMVSPKQYDIYEIADDWAEWLARTYSPLVVRQFTDGHTLSATPDESCGLVHAHGVFVYLSILHAYEYFLHMLRVCRPNGFIVFDFYKAESFDEAMIMNWLPHKEQFPVALMQQHMECFFRNRGCELIREFDNKHSHGYSHYVAFQKIRKEPS
jgi:SAM-dependent methyltransferase